MNVTIVNPKCVIIVKGNKDDTKDSKWISNLFSLGLIPGSYIRSKPIRILHVFTLYRYKLFSSRSSEKNRFQNAYTVCNVALDSVMSDIFDKSSTAVVEYLLETDAINPDYISSSLCGSLKKKTDSVLESIDGYVMQQEQKQRICIVKEHMRYINSCIVEIDALIDKMVSPYESQISLLSTILGVDRAHAITIIFEVGINLH